MSNLYKNVLLLFFIRKTRKKTNKETRDKKCASKTNLNIFFLIFAENQLKLLRKNIDFLFENKKHNF